ncbi:MAG: J domain-containing protein [Syntrophaceae bacterium]|nr:J domain-containing protein [Syntrophaceae bacterium]
MIKRDYYDLLEIDPSATLGEIKKAYRRLAHRYHPDKNPNNPSAEERFRLITEAYEVLQDSGKRSAYDRQGPSRGRGGFGGGRPSPGRSGAKDAFDGIFDEVLEDFFGARGRTEKKEKGADLRYSLEISLEEAALGSQKTVRFNRRSICPLCGGSRCAPGTEPELCHSCRGAGSLQSHRGFFVVETACDRCKGEGKYIPRPCPRCGGVGHIKSRPAFTIQTPPGAENGTRLRIAGEGDMGRNGGPPGDLFVVLSVLQHPVFERVGNDLQCEIPVSLAQAFRGAEIQVPVLNGSVRMKVPPKTPPGKVFILKGLGMPFLQKKGKGNLRVKIRVEAPGRPGKEEREMQEDLARQGKTRPGSEPATFSH